MSTGQKRRLNLLRPPYEAPKTEPRLPQLVLTLADESEDNKVLFKRELTQSAGAMLMTLLNIPLPQKAVEAVKSPAPEIPDEIVGLSVLPGHVSFVHLRRDEFSPCGWRRLDHGFALHRPDQSLASVLSDLSLPEDVPYVINAGSPRYCIVKKISLPDWTEEEFYQSLAWEIEQFIPYDVRRVYFDGMSLPGDLHQGDRDYLITATKKDELDPILQAMAGKDLKVMIATPTEMALLAAFEHCYPQSVSGNTALVDYSPDGTQILVLRDGQIAFSRHISSIGGVPLERMVVEVKRSLDFFNATNMDTDIQRVLVSGYDYRDQELGLLSEKLQLPVENFVIPQPGPVGTLNSAHVMAYGLALIGLGF